MQHIRKSNKLLCILCYYFLIFFVSLPTLAEAGTEGPPDCDDGRPVNAYRCFYRVGLPLDGPCAPAGKIHQSVIVCGFGCPKLCWGQVDCDSEQGLFYWPEPDTTKVVTYVCRGPNSPPTNYNIFWHQLKCEAKTGGSEACDSYEKQITCPPGRGGEEITIHPPKIKKIRGRDSLC